MMAPGRLPSDRYRPALSTAAFICDTQPGTTRR